MTVDPGQDRVNLPPADAPAPVVCGVPPRAPESSFWCEAHNLPAACCRYCVDPGLLGEDWALLEVGEWALCGAVWLEVVHGPDGALGLEPIKGGATP